jgi:hypothetical protein
VFVGAAAVAVAVWLPLRVVREEPTRFVYGFSLEDTEAVALIAPVLADRRDIVPVGRELAVKSERMSVGVASSPVIRLWVPVRVSMTCAEEEL